MKHIQDEKFNVHFELTLMHVDIFMKNFELTLKHVDIFMKQNV